MESINILLHELTLLTVFIIFFVVIFHTHGLIVKSLEKLSYQPKYYSLVRAFDLSLLNNCGGSGYAINFTAVQVSDVLLTAEGGMKVDVLLIPHRGECE